MFYSPLRYPGGKSKITAYVLETIKLNGLEGEAYVEPFAGGCAIAWHLLLNGHVRKVYINDLDPAIHAFWHSVLYRTEELCELIKGSPVTIEEWFKQRELYRKNTGDFLKLGFATLFLNRTNRSGIIKGGVIGGLQQNGNYKLDCRFNKDKIINLILLISAKKDFIRLSNMDAASYIENYIPDIEGKAFINIDPPYYVKGKGLYQNFFEHEDHHRLFESVRSISQPWIVTYDNVPEICNLYADFLPESFGLTYTAQTKYLGSEVIIHSKGLLKPRFKPDITFNNIRKINCMK